MSPSSPSLTTPGTSRPRLPDRLKVLYVTTLHRSGDWLNEAFGADSATIVALQEAVGVTAGLGLLRDELFDAVLVNHEPGLLDALDFIEALRTGGHEEPMIVVGTDPPEVFQALAYEVGADAYCWIEQTTTRSLLWEVSRAIRRFELVRENRRLVEAQRQRLANEHVEAERLLSEQRALLSDLESLAEEGQELPLRNTFEARTSPLEPAIHDPSQVKRYRDLLQAYVVMGAGNMSREIAQLVDMLALDGVSAHDAMQLHIDVLEGMIHGLGRRSARHVMNRADLLIMELMIHLADGYRQRWRDRADPPVQKWLPGMELEPLN
jgi:DNA-binding response OmpR family regulator